MKLLICTFILLLSVSAFAQRNQGVFKGELTEIFIDSKSKCILFVESTQRITGKGTTKITKGKRIQSFGFVTTASTCKQERVRLNQIISKNDVIKDSENEKFDGRPSPLIEVTIPNTKFKKLSAREMDQDLEAYKKIDPDSFYINLDSASAVIEAK